jgi:hypothetical protein
MDRSNVSTETLHSMKVEKFFPALEDSFEGPGFWASHKSVEVAANTVPPAQARQSRGPWSNASHHRAVPVFSGSLESYEEPVSIAPELFSRIQLAAEPEPRSHRISAKPRARSDSCAEPSFLAPRIVDFLTRFPQVDVRLVEDVTLRLVDGLQAGELDVPLASPPISNPDVVCC